MLVKTPPKGMRDILPRDLALRQRIMDIIKEVYTSYGFTQIETPCVEDIKNLGRRTVRPGAEIRPHRAAVEILRQQRRQSA